MAKERAARKSRNNPHQVAQLPSPETPKIADSASVAQVRTSVFTLRHLIDSYETHLGLLVRAGVNAPATLQWYRDNFKALEGLGDFAADTLRTHHLGAITLTNAFVRVLKRLYKWGASEDLVPKDPFAKLTIPPCGRRERVLSREDLRKLYLAASRPFRRLLFVQLRTLARPGEIRQLTWGQIDWDHRVIVLVKFKGKKFRRDKLKARAIPLDKAVVRMLRNLHRKSVDKSETGRVFIGERGKPLTPNGVRCLMRKARVVAGLDGGDEPVVCYHLRHTGATNAVRLDLNLKLVAEVMGHARTSTTERYTHLDTADVVAAIDRMAARPRPNRAG